MIAFWKKPNRIAVTALAVMAALSLASCSQTEKNPIDTKLRVFVSILPQAYFVQRIGGDLIEVDVLVAAGQSPATYDPTPRQMAALNDANVYFRIGVPFEEFLHDKIASSFESLLVVDTREGITLRSMAGHHHDDGLHEGELPESGDDPHIWLAPALVKQQARTISETLCRLDSTHAATFRANLDAFLADLDSVDAEIKTVCQNLTGRRMFVFHPSYGYFADACGLEQVAVEVEGKEPSARQLAILVDQMKTDSVRVLFVQPQFSKRTAETIATAIDGQVVPLDPLSPDYLANLRAMAAKIADALSGSSTGAPADTPSLGGGK